MDSPGVALAHRRLKVLDLTHGQQPVVSSDGRWAMVYNGEVYNFADLRRKYEARGLTFDTRCDTEVVFAALNRDGPDAIDDFNGMFALGHWDDQQRRLLLVRDRLGKKPLYWYADGEKLVFASELKAVLEYLGQRFEIDSVALDQYFGRGYVLAPRTIFQGIHKLAAGTRLRLDAGQGQWQWQVEPYWDVTLREIPAAAGAEQDSGFDSGPLLDELDALLTDAVRIRLVSDVPIGCLLSGGIDSSLVTALAAKVSSDPVAAFSIGFDESEDLNELPYAEMVAKRHNCRWFNRRVRADDFLPALETVADFLDEPYGNFTATSMRQLARMAREHLVVVLSGQGGDELSGGYPGRYNWVAQYATIDGKRPVMAQYAPPLDDLLQYRRFSSFVPWGGGREAIFSAGLLDAVCSAAGPMDDLLPFWTRPEPGDRLNRVLYTDVKTNLADYLILYEERMTMSCSLEARNPLLDYRVVEFLLSLPASVKLRDGRNKWVLTELARRYMPREAIDRPKRGFTPPLGLWIASHAAALAELFAATAGQTRACYSLHWQNYLLAGRYEAGAMMPVFYSLMLALWAQRYGKYIAHWPGEGDHGRSHPARPALAGCVSSDSLSPASGIGPMWEQAFRQQDPATLAQGRWFCQGLGNFPAQARILLLGDHDGWYAALARGCGATVTAPTAGEPLESIEGPFDGVVMIGRDCVIDSVLTRAVEWKQLTLGAGVAGGILLFIPYTVDQQETIRQLLERVSSNLPIRGFQAAPLGGNRAVLVARAGLPAAANRSN